MTNTSAYIVELLIGLPIRDWDCKCSVCRQTSQDEFWHSSRKPQKSIHNYKTTMVPKEHGW